MNIGSLYTVKKWFWLLFPTKETAEEAEGRGDVPEGLHPPFARAEVAWYSKRYNCEVIYFSLDSIVVFLEEDGVFKKVLTSDGLVGWTWFNENYNDCFEEMKTE
jgi:hypothetical protein